MKNEPVAWMGKDYDGIKTDFYFDVERNKLPYRLYETAIPLYTHPADLIDEEIIKMYENMLGVASARSSAIDFARAILRKAQEK